MKVSKLIVLLGLVSCGMAEEWREVVQNKRRDETCIITESPEKRTITCGDQTYDLDQDIELDAMALVELCPEISGSFIESLLYVNGEYFAFLSNSNYKKQRMVVLPTDTLLSSTDGRNVKFTIAGKDIEYNDPKCEDYLGE